MRSWRYFLISGVDLWKLEQRPNVGTMLLKLDFDTDVAPRLLFLKDNGVEESRFGYILTHNPFILTEDLENLHARWQIKETFTNKYICNNCVGCAVIFCLKVSTFVVFIE